MKKNYKRNFLIVIIGILNLGTIHSQVSNMGNTFTGGFLGWNNTNGVNPLLFRTNNLTRIRLNGNQTANISFINQNTSGYLGISPSGYFNTNSPWSMLHLEGPNNTIFTGGQWRSWMKTGLFMRENSDAMYVGLKQEAGTNRSDAIVSWSDDAGSDRLRFLFTGTSLNGNGDNQTTGQTQTSFT